MSEHKASIAWARTSRAFDYQSYNREHTWTFDNGATVDAAAAPEFLGSPDCVDPEEAFTAAVAACHMLTFLALAARKGIIVNRYRDDAVGELSKNDSGRLAVTRVALRPRIEFETDPSREELEKLHELAHRGCFIANSVKCRIDVDF